MPQDNEKKSVAQYRERLKQMVDEKYPTLPEKKKTDHDGGGIHSKRHHHSRSSREGRRDKRGAS